MSKNDIRGFHNNWSPQPERLKSYEKENIIDGDLEIIDPTPSIHSLFVQFNRRFFWNKLRTVEVKWSPRMTSCAGVCSYNGRNGHCCISLSSPLLSFRSRKDLVETLLHEMIHAFLFVTDNDRDRDGHGPNFHKHMDRINKEAGTNISVYHSFHDEVKHHQRHVWRCDGPCQKRKPFFGLVRRAMNRAPGPNDFWWGRHKQECGGKFVKISEPEKKKGKTKNVSEGRVAGKDIRTFFSPDGKSVKAVPPTAKDQGGGSQKGKEAESLRGVGVVEGRGRTLLGSSNTNIASKVESSSLEVEVLNTVRDVWSKRFPGTSCQSVNKKRVLSCPVCDNSVAEDEIEQHVNACVQNQEASAGHAPSGHAPSDSPIILGEYAPCPVCNRKVQAGELKPHLEECLDGSFQEDEMNDEDEMKSETASVPCPCCLQWFPEDAMNYHIDDCLTQIAIKNGLLEES